MASRLPTACQARQGASRGLTAVEVGAAPARRAASPSNCRRRLARCQRTGWLARTNRPALPAAHWAVRQGAYMALALMARWRALVGEAAHPPSVSLSANPPRLAVASVHKRHKRSGRAEVARYKTRMIAYGPFLAWLRFYDDRATSVSGTIITALLLRSKSAGGRACEKLDHWLRVFRLPQQWQAPGRFNHCQQVIVIFGH